MRGWSCQHNILGERMIEEGLLVIFTLLQQVSIHFIEPFGLGEESRGLDYLTMVILDGDAAGKGFPLLGFQLNLALPVIGNNIVSIVHGEDIPLRGLDGWRRVV